MPIGIRATMVRRLGARQPFQLEANHRLEPNEWTKLATYPYCLLQTEPADHLIVSVPYISLCAEPRSIASILRQLPELSRGRAGKRTPAPCATPPHNRPIPSGAPPIVRVPKPRKVSPLA